MTDHPSALVSVPEEPTPDMNIAGGIAISEARHEALTLVDEADACFRAMLAAAPAAPQAAGVGEDVNRAFACVDQVAKGAQVSEVYGGEWCLDPALEFRAHLRAILAALSPEAPALNTIGCAELEVGRAVYERIEKLIDTTTGPDAEELSYLAHLAASVEEVGGYDGPEAPAREVTDAMVEAACSRFVSESDDIWSTSVWPEGRDDDGDRGDGGRVRLISEDDQHKIRAAMRFALQDALTPRHEAPAETLGYLFEDDDGTEWSEADPRVSGENEYATNVRPVTLAMAVAEMRSAWELLSEQREALIQADLKIRSLPGTDQSDVEGLRAVIDAKHEAPAEGAGEAMDAGFEEWLNERNLLPNGAWDWPSIVAMLNHHEDALRARSSAPEAREGEAAAWACKTCNSPRAVDPCPKCGTELTKPADGWDWPRLPDIDRIRELAREVGYAVGVHGTLERDLDLIAVPWIAEAVTPFELAQHIASALGGNVLDYKTQDKPCGRWSCNINSDGWFKLIDVSVMPPHPAAPSADQAELAQLAEAAGEEALGNLLAVIHGDGGHRALEVGVEQAAAEAEKIVAGLFAAPSADKLQDALKETWDALTALREAFALDGVYDGPKGKALRLSNAAIRSAASALKTEGAK